MNKDINQFKTKIFPFSPGIQWKVDEDDCIIKYLPEIRLNNILKNKKIIATSFGGLIDVYISLILFEQIPIYLNNIFYWNVDSKYKEILSFYGKNIKYVNNVSEKIAVKYPTPIFMDKKNGAYFNFSFNNIKKINIRGILANDSNKSYLESLIDSTLMPWNGELPIFRNLSSIPNILQISQLSSKRYALIIPDSMRISKIPRIGHKWKHIQFKSFCQMISSKGIIPVLLTNDSIYKSFGYQVFSPTFGNYFALLENSLFTISNEIDFQLISILNNKPAMEEDIGAKNIQTSIEENYKWMINTSAYKKDGDILYGKDISPIESFDFFKQWV